MTQNNLFTDTLDESLPAPRQKLLAVIHVFDEAIHYARYDDGKEMLGHQVDPTDLASAMAGVPITTGLLPEDCLFYGRAGSLERLGVYLPPAYRRLQVATSKKPRAIDIPTPPLVFWGQGSEYYIAALKQRPGVDDRLFRAPFPNVHHSGRICQGSADFPICSAKTIRAAAAAFFESLFNNHLADVKSKAHPRNVMAQWYAMKRAGAEEYPLDDLVPSNMLVSHLIGGKIQ